MKTLLIVDDDASVCEVLSRFFASLGFHTLTAQSGHDALALLDDARELDYLLLDLRMPDVSGMEVLKQAKERRPDLKIVIVTGLEDRDITEEAIRCGASDVVTKPVAFTDRDWARAFFTPA
jgi:two-component system NtrC family response regulator